MTPAVACIGGLPLAEALRRIRRAELVRTATPAKVEDALKSLQDALALLPNDPALQDIKSWTEMRVKQMEPCSPGETLNAGTTTKTDSKTGITVVLDQDGNPIGTLGAPPDDVVKDLEGNVLGKRTAEGDVVAVGWKHSASSPALTKTPLGSAVPVTDVPKALDRIMSVAGSQIAADALQTFKGLVD